MLSCSTCDSPATLICDCCVDTPAVGLRRCASCQAVTRIAGLVPFQQGPVCALSSCTKPPRSEEQRYCSHEHWRLGHGGYATERRSTVNVHTGTITIDTPLHSNVEKARGIRAPRSIVCQGDYVEDNGCI